MLISESGKDTFAASSVRKNELRCVLLLCGPHSLQGLAEGIDYMHHHYPGIFLCLSSGVPESEKIKGRQNMQADGIPRRFRAGIPPAFTVFIYCSSFTVLHLRVSYYYSVFAGRLSDHAPVPSHLSQCQIGRRRESYRQELRFL